MKPKKTHTTTHPHTNIPTPRHTYTRTHTNKHIHTYTQHVRYLYDKVSGRVSGHLGQLYHQLSEPGATGGVNHPT